MPAVLRIQTIRFLSILCLSLVGVSGAAAQTVRNASFETPALASDTESLRPTGASWVFTGQAGIRNLRAPNGSSDKQVAFLSAAPSGSNNNFGTITQSISFAPGTYYVRYLAAVKTPAGRPQPLKMSIDGVAIGGLLNQRYITDASTGGFEAGWTVPFVVSTAGTHEIKFEATNATNYGTVAAPLYGVAYLDAITIVSAVGVLVNQGFETASAWTLSAGATRVPASNAPEGSSVLSLASGASASQSVSLGAGRYSLSLKSGKATAATATLRVDVASNGGTATTVATIGATTADEYRSYSTVGFDLPAGTHVVTITAVGGGVSLDNVAINDAGPEPANSTFETPSLAAPTSATAAGPTVANPTNASWAFSGTGDLIQGNAGRSNTSAPRTLYGKQYVALSGTGKVTQNLVVEGGIYVAIGQMAQGGGDGVGRRRERRQTVGIHA
ncbi:MAG: hypothetical protein LC098_00510 [Burkholderiales bacterium]|nr:hypothetical protein [Burkholderiales bacterium]